MEIPVKVLPEHVASDPDLKQRFEREMAKARLSGAQLEELRSPPEEIDEVDADDFLYTDDDGPE